MPTLIYNTSATQQARLGEEYTLRTDRVFRYAKNGPAALPVGTVLQGPRPNDSHANMTVNAATAVGATSVTVILDRGDPMTLNEYKDGYLYINDQGVTLTNEGGQGILYEVDSHPGGDAGEDTTKKITIKDSIVVALTTSSQATLTPNKYSGVIKPGRDPFDIIVGVNPVAVPANEFFWCQVRGPAVVLQSGRLFAGQGVMLSQKISGAVEVLKQVIPIEREVHSGITNRSGTGTIANAATSTTITHGLGGLPGLEDISIIQGENASNAIDAFWVDTITTTQFNVNSPDPGASGLDFGWHARRIDSPAIGTEGAQFQQKGIELRPQGDTQRTEDEEILTEVAGKATIPVRPLGYCINNRVSTEHALVYLTIS